MDVVDGHLHLFKALSDTYPRAVFEGMTPPEREESAERLLEAMDTAGVDRAVYCALSEHDHYLAEVLAQHPGKFAGVSVYDFTDPHPLATLQRRIDAGIEGVRFYGLEGEPGADPESLAVFPALAAMRDAGMKVWFYGPADQIALLDGCLDLLPGLRVVLNHLGFLPNMHLELMVDDYGRPRFDMPLPPPGLEVVEALAAKHSSVHVHFSGHYAFSGAPYPYRDLQETTDRIYAAFGADRMLMASDWPWIREEPGYPETLGVIDQLLGNISPAEREMIRGGTAMSLFDF
ncbi:MAG: amidohydrolase family protein [Acidimicrobiaceae bacterium]|nr:amidohydrolase family protein [Acidimicrobiaceae bacterium]